MTAAMKWMRVAITFAIQERNPTAARVHKATDLLTTNSVSHKASMENWEGKNILLKSKTPVKGFGCKTGCGHTGDSQYYVAPLNWGKLF